MSSAAEAPLLQRLAPLRPGPAVAEAVGLGVFYLAAALVSIALSRQSASVANLWLANALTVAWLVTTGPRRWPQLLAVAALANVLANLIGGDGVVAAVAFVPANIVESLLAALLLRRAGLQRSGLRSPLAMLQLLGFGALILPLAGATLGAATLHARGAGDFWPLWQTWYESEALGAISLLALVLCLRSDRAELIRRDLLDWRMLVLGALAVGVTLPSLAYVPFPFVYIAIPLLVAATMLELSAVLLLTLVVSLVIAGALATGVFEPPPFAARWQQLFVYTAYAAALMPAQLLAAAIAGMRDSLERLELTTAELRRANEGLEQFVHIASHDLREPLNTIVQFTGLIEHDHGPQMPPQARSWLSLVGRAGSRMRRLLDDVLHYTRVQRGVSDPGHAVELDPVIQDVLQSLAGRIRDSGASVSVESMPVVRGHESLLALLFQNLLSNAIKFMPPGKVPVVRVGVRCEGGQAEISVVDNGIGIEAQDIPKLFQPFQRLHLRKHYEGTGLGLALVRQVAQAHGGSVAIRSEPGQGTRVLVRLRLEEAAAKVRPPVTRY